MGIDQFAGFYGSDQFAGFYGSDRFAGFHGSNRSPLCSVCWVLWVTSLPLFYFNLSYGGLVVVAAVGGWWL